MADRIIFQSVKAESSYKVICWHIKECGTDSDLDSITINPDIEM
jgi:hypothetical protein